MKRRGGFGLIAVAIIAATIGIAFLAAGVFELLRATVGT
jgi:hypothetical protein